MIESVLPNDRAHWLELRSRVLTSTETAALFGCSPYLTLFELWHRKRDQVITTIDENERMKWGTRLESSIAHGIAEDEDWTIRRVREFKWDTELKIGSSFDFAITEVLEREDLVHEARDIAGLEIKNVDSMVFKGEWAYDGEELEAPPHIEIQVQTQMIVSRLPYTIIGALVGGNNVNKIRRDANPTIQNAIKQKSAEFWKSIEDNVPPQPDFEKDAEYIQSLYNFANPGSVLDGRGDMDLATLAMEYKRAADVAKEADSQKQAAKAQLLMKIQDAEKVVGDGFNITAGMVGPARIEYDREGYRNFRITWPKAKGK